MNQSLLQQTQVNVTFSFQIVTDREAELMMILQLLVTLITYLAQGWQASSHFVYQVAILITDLLEALSFTSKVFAIGFKSLAYGLGVSL